MKEPWKTMTLMLMASFGSGLISATIEPRSRAAEFAMGISLLVDCILIAMARNET
jgi:hypothetical protein